MLRVSSVFFRNIRLGLELDVDRGGIRESFTKFGKSFNFKQRWILAVLPRFGKSANIGVLKVLAVSPNLVISCRDKFYQFYQI